MKKRLIFSVHAVRRMFERGIAVDEVRAVLEGGEIIEAYPDDRPCPSRLILGKVGSRFVHIVLASNTDADEEVVITVYQPDTRIWNSDFRTRRKK